MSEAITLSSPLDHKTLSLITHLICERPKYRTARQIHEFLGAAGIARTISGSRGPGTNELLRSLTAAESQRVVLRLADPREYGDEHQLLRTVVEELNKILRAENCRVDFSGSTPFLAAESLDLSSLASPALDPSMASFLSLIFPNDIAVSTLGLSSTLEPFIQSRIDEAKRLPRHAAPVATILLLGSALEGILLALVEQHRAQFGRVVGGKGAANPEGLKLAELIDGATKLGALDADVCEFGNALRDFRNYIHPNKQRGSAFYPTQDTADVCWQVFKAAFQQVKAWNADHPSDIESPLGTTERSAEVSLEQSMETR